MRADQHTGKDLADDSGLSQPLENLGHQPCRAKHDKERQRNQSGIGWGKNRSERSHSLNYRAGHNYYSVAPAFLSNCAMAVWPFLSAQARAVRLSLSLASMSGCARNRTCTLASRSVPVSTALVRT